MSEHSERTLKRLFAHAIGIEFLASRIYLDFAKMFEDHEKIFRFWKGMREDELQHAEILKETRNSLPEETLAEDAGSHMWDILLIVKKYLKRYKKKDIRTLDDACEMAHQIESSEINSLFRVLTLGFFSSHVREAFILSEINDHQKKLAEFTQRHGSRAFRKSIYAKHE